MAVIDKPFKLLPISQDPLAFRVPAEFMGVASTADDLIRDKVAAIRNRLNDQLEAACAEAIARGPSWAVGISPLDFDQEGEHPTVGRSILLIEQPVPLESYPGWTFLVRSDVTDA